MENKIKISVVRIIDIAGLVLIGSFSAAYSLFDRVFAELHINIHPLNFPIFIGEILFFLCLVLLIIKWKFILATQNIYPIHYVLFCYIGYIVLNTLWGYTRWGPLALRHAALFYYPFFILFGYEFYRSEFFDVWKILLLSILLITIPFYAQFYSYTSLTCFILALILIRAYPYIITRYILFLALFIFTRYSLLFNTSRSMFIANVISFFYLIFFSCPFLNIKNKNYALLLRASLFLLIVCGIFLLSNKGSLKSLIDFKNSFGLLKEYDSFVQKKKDTFVSPNLKIQLYTTEQTVFFIPFVQAPPQQQRKPQKPLNYSLKGKTKLQQQTTLSQQTQPSPASFSMLPKEIKPPKVTSQQIALSQTPRDNYSFFLERGSMNALFRWFIWRDILTQLWREKAIFGFGFGKPLRSQSIEILNWADSDWKKDGWITAHNSYLQAIYNVGLLGFLFLGFLLMTLLKLIKRVIFLKSITGVLLTAILINWLLAANFLVILELPYNAIPFWSLFGMTLAYVYKKQNGLLKEESALK